MVTLLNYEEKLNDNNNLKKIINKYFYLLANNEISENKELNENTVLINNNNEIEKENLNKLIQEVLKGLNSELEDININYIKNSIYKNSPETFKRRVNDIKEFIENVVLEKKAKNIKNRVLSYLDNKTKNKIKEIVKEIDIVYNELEKIEKELKNKYRIELEKIEKAYAVLKEEEPEKAQELYNHYYTIHYDKNNLPIRLFENKNWDKELQQANTEELNLLINNYKIKEALKKYEEISKNLKNNQKKNFQIR